MADKNRIVIDLLRVSAYLMREGTRITNPYGLNQQQFVVLNHINNYHPLHQNEICSRLLFEKSNVSKIINKLNKMGLIETKGSDHDKRYKTINCTLKGSELVERVNKEFNSFNKDFLRGLSEEELDSTQVSINRLSMNIST